MSLNSSIATLPRADKARADGTLPIYHFVRVGPAPARKIHTGYYIHPDDWDKKKRCPKNSSETLKALAICLNEITQGFNKYMLEQRASGKPITLMMALVYFEKKKTVRLFDFWEERMNYWEGKYAPATLKSYQSVLRILKAFNPRLDFEDINVKVIEAFDRYLETERNNHLNGRFVKHKCLKAMLNEAIKHGYLKTNPYTHNFKIRSEDIERSALVMEELRQLIGFSIPEQTPGLHLVKDLFLFSCYTGLRYSDTMALQSKDIKTDDLKSWLELRIQKTKRKLIVPLCPEALLLIEKYQGLNSKDPQKMFPYIANPQINRGLKDLMKLAGINKTISFHSARHSFATIHVEHNTDLIFVRDLLGHKNLRQTEIYGKVTGSNLFASMNAISSQYNKTQENDHNPKNQKRAVNQ
jgi:integrase/recombinase XerD